MAKEYIERSIAITLADYAADEHPYTKKAGEPETYSDYNRGWNDACDYIREKLDGVPTAYVAPVVHGRWLPNNFRDPAFFICDQCGAMVLSEIFCCPSCLARMGGEGAQHAGAL